MNEYSTLLHNVRHPKCHCIHIHPSPSITSGAKHPVFPYTSNPYFPHGGENDDHHQFSHIITYLTQNIHIFRILTRPHHGNQNQYTLYIYFNRKHTDIKKNVPSRCNVVLFHMYRYDYYNISV